MKNPENRFLKDKYADKLAFSGAVKKKARKDAGFKKPEKFVDKIPYYLERIEKVASRKDPKTGERGKLFKEKSLYPKYVIKPENITDDYIKNVIYGNYAEKLGYNNEQRKNKEVRENILVRFREETGEDFEQYTIPKKERESVVEATVKDQKSRLNTWFDYVTSPEARNYSATFRYWAFAELLKLGDYDREKKKFTKRTKKTVKLFPRLNQEALAIVLDNILKKLKGEDVSLKLKNEKEQEEFTKRLQGENFGQLYAFALEHVESFSISDEQLKITQGEWRKFEKGSDAKEMSKTLEGKNTEWCIAGEGTAAGYLEHSDVWIYYSKEKKTSKNTLPRACLVSSPEQGITEVRGIVSDGKGSNQHLDSYINPKVEEQLESMEGGKKWMSTMSDMKELAGIEIKYLNDEVLNKKDLTFLYEINKPIQRSGYNKDPRIKEILEQRNVKEDAPILLECKPEQIAYSEQDVNADTKAYIGTLFKDFFNIIPKSVDHIYTKFPERPVWHKKLLIDYDKPLEEQVKDGNYDAISKEYISDGDVSEEKNKFTIKGEGKEEQELVLVNIDGRMSTTEAEAEIKRLGLELPEVVDILAVGSQYPELQRKNFIVALLEEGSRVRDSRGHVVVPVLDGHSLKRNLDLSYCDGRWSDDDGFLARRK